jgi:nicotinamide-nucleotide amidase
MFAEIITIGDEILIGQVVDTNSAWISKQFSYCGIQVVQITSVSDKKERITEALKNAEQRADIIIITGGLGPTKDDITKNTLCDYFNTRLVFNQEVFNDLELFFSTRGRKITETNRSQALIPENCIHLRNYQGTAPGMWFEKDDKVIVSLPGVPYEMKA